MSGDLVADALAKLEEVYDQRDALAQELADARRALVDLRQISHLANIQRGLAPIPSDRVVTAAIRDALYRHYRADVDGAVLDIIAALRKLGLRAPETL